MSRRLVVLGVMWLAAFGTNVTCGQTAAKAPEHQLPKTIESAACQVVPLIDGVLNEDEWKDAPAMKFDLMMVQLKSFAITPRPCELRVKNSANALYLALRVPDETFNNRMSPIDIDFVQLLFCRGKELSPGDDRKVLAPGLYADKHFTKQGKDDADDQHKDGLGAAGHDKKVYTFEWAIPLDSGDKEDLQAKPGDTIRFNLAYFDAFQADMKDTKAGVVFGHTLNRVADWGLLHLAGNVKDDGGAAFKGPAWVEALFKGLEKAPANRLRFVGSTPLPNQAAPGVKVIVEYTHRDPHGKPRTDKAKLYLPASVKDEKSKIPLYFNAGYELDDNSAMGHVQRGWAVATPAELEANPLVRTINPDTALLHMARSLPFVDDARVVVGGGSAGGYATLLVAAETFPLAGAAPQVPPMNWGYNAAFFLQRKREAKGGSSDPNAPKLPVFEVIVPIAEQAVEVFGPDTNDLTWYRHSPLAQLSTITCPVCVYWSTADMLVPIDQIGKNWVRPFDAKAYPKGFSFDPEKLMNSAEGRTRFLDVLSDKVYELFVTPEDKLRDLVAGKGGKLPAELPVSRTKQWSVTILDEGRPEPQLGHVKYPVPWSHADFFSHVVTGKTPAGQLTRPKLERLMDRYAGKEWLPTRLVHLDDAESERADVLRGLRTYVASGEANAKTLASLYAKLPPARQVLEAEVLRQLVGR